MNSGINKAVIAVLDIDSKLLPKKSKVFQAYTINNTNAKVIGVKILHGIVSNNYIQHIKHVEDIKRENRIEVGNKRSNIQETVSHTLSKQIVDYVSKFKNPVVFFEELNFNKKKLRQKNGGKGTKSNRKMLNSWRYSDVKEKTIYKLKTIGVYAMDINPMYTSQKCNKCGTMGIRDGVHFKCNECGLGTDSNSANTIGQYNADVNASINIALTGLYYLYDKTGGSVMAPNVHPNESVMNSIPTNMINTERNNSENNRLDETTLLQLDRNSLAVKEQSMV